MAKKESKLEAALLKAVESATEEMFSAYRLTTRNLNLKLREELAEYAEGIYRGAWLVSLWLDRELPKPTEWTKWAREAAESVHA